MKDKKKFSVAPDSKVHGNKKTGVEDTRKATDIDSVLKDHLKASISMENLEVSEDLIQRTLQKIKQSEMNAESDVNNKEQIIRNRNRNLRRFVSAAAAIVLVAVSVTVWQSGLIGSGNKQSLVKGIDQSVPDPAAGIMEIAPDTESPENSNDYSIMSERNAESGLDTADEIKKQDSTLAQDKYTGESGNTGSLESSDLGELSVTMSVPSVFSANFPIDSYKDVTHLSVTKKGNEPVTGAKLAAKTEELYGILDEYVISASADNLSDNWIYSVEIKLKEDKQIEVYIWESGDIAVSTEASEGKNYYTLDNGKNFLKKFDEFYASLY